MYKIKQYVKYDNSSEFYISNFVDHKTSYYYVLPDLTLSKSCHEGWYKSKEEAKGVLDRFNKQNKNGKERKEMNIKEALEVMLDGKKVTNSTMGSEYTSWDGRKFVYNNGHLLHIDDCTKKSGWILYVEPITFLEAVEEMNTGSEVKCVDNGDIYYMISGAIYKKAWGACPQIDYDMIHSGWEVC